MNELKAAIHANDLEEFSRWLQREPDSGFQVELLENAAYTDRGPFISRLIELNPALKVTCPPSSALEFALEYGNAHLIPLLTQIWPLPGDLPHAAGVGDSRESRVGSMKPAIPGSAASASITLSTILPGSGISIGHPRTRSTFWMSRWHGRA